MNSSKVVYRPDIDGLRAIAVLLVVAYHAFPEFIPGGFIGVDVFFVISGFLISSILIKDLESGQYSLWTFYSRRFRRIVPALVITFVGTWILARQLLLPQEFANLGKHILASALFSENFLLNAEAGYFDDSSESKPLLHIWSLSVEEQFYVVWPVLLAVAFRRKWRLANVILLVGGVSFLANIFLVRTFPSLVFYQMPTRLWQLAAGALLAALSLGTIRSSWANLGAGLALCGLLASSFVLNGHSVYPGLNAVIPTLAAALLIGFSAHSWFNRFLLATKPLVWIGLISYPLYLWHWPLLTLFRIEAHEPLTPTVTVLLVGLSAVLATATYILVEKPLRVSHAIRSFGSRRIVTTSLVILALVAGAGALTYYSDALLSTNQKKLSSLVEATQIFKRDSEKDLLDRGCFQDSIPFPDHCIRPGGILLWGDSMMAQFYSSIERVAGKVSISQLTSSSCPPILEAGFPMPTKCKAINDYAVEQVKRIRPKVVVLAADWPSHWSGEDTFDKSLETSIRFLQMSGVERVVVFGSPVSWPKPLPLLLIRKFYAKGISVPQRLEANIARSIELDRLLQIGASKLGATFISLTDVFCSSEGCLTKFGNDFPNEIVAWDRHHFSKPAADLVVKSKVLSIVESVRIKGDAGRD